MKQSEQPPLWATSLLKWLCIPHLVEEIQGDLLETYQNDLSRKGKKAADRQYVLNVITFVRLRFGFKRAGLSLLVVNSLHNNSKSQFMDMLRNYFKISLRNLWRNRTTSLISVFGLSVGIASGLIIFLLVSYLFSFNSDYANAGRTYMIATDILQENIQHTDVTPRPMGEVLRREYPFVETAVRLNNLFGSVVGVPDGKGGTVKKFEESRNICFTEPQFFKIFDTKWVHGDMKTALVNPNTVVLSREYAKKYFGTENVLGKTLRFENKLNLTVTGVTENPPSNTQLRYDILISYASIPAFYGNPDMMNAWNEPSTMCWVTLKKDAGMAELVNSLRGIGKKYYSAREAKQYSFQVIPLTEMYHHPYYGAAPRPILYALIAVGLFLVIASCVNFINLSTAQAIKRSREVGVRKTMGSTRRQLIGQFMLETALMCIVAFVIALGLAQLNLPLLNRALWMLRANISVLDMFSSRGLVWFGGFIAGVILLAGLYPSVILARFNPVTALKGKLTTQKLGNLSVRKGLVVFQFFITQVFIIGVLVMSAQVRYMKNSDLGFQKENQISVMLPYADAGKQEIFRQQLMRLKQVEQVTICDLPPASQNKNFSEFTYDTRTESEKFVTNIREADRNYISVFGLTLLAGENFSVANGYTGNDSLRSGSEVMINEKMVKQLGVGSLNEVLGRQLTIGGKQKTIVGVVKNFGLGGMRDDIQPVTIINNTEGNYRSIIKITPGDLSGTVKEIDQIWNGLYPDGIFKAQFVDELVAEFYTTENILLGLIQAFSVIAVLIGCLGLYGLVTFIAESRNKEIGVRKILGASTKQVLWIFGREFGMLIVLGFAIAAPVGWFLMNGWLQGYAQRITLGWWVFASTGGLVVTITLLTISVQSLKAAGMNPVTSLKNE